MTFCNLSVSPLHREERQRLNMMQKTGLDTLIRFVCKFYKLSDCIDNSQV